jgi:transcriptional regulator with XRE-family HTH domain
MADRNDQEAGQGHVIGLPAGHRSGKASEDWEVVAKALDHRLDELGWTQTVLAQRSRVSSATIRELLHGAERRRNARTLQDVSIALGWHPDHLGATLYGRPPPAPDLAGAGGKPLQEHLEAIYIRLDQLTARLAVVKDTVEFINAKLSPRPTKNTVPWADGSLPPIPVNKTDVRRFAGRHGYTMERAGRVWNARTTRTNTKPMKTVVCRRSTISDLPANPTATGMSASLISAACTNSWWPANACEGHGGEQRRRISPSWFIWCMTTWDWTSRWFSEP